MNNRSRIFIPLILFAVIFNNCGKLSPKCWGGDKNKGIIIRDLNIACFPGIDKAIISSASEFRILADSSCALPDVDFSTETLLYMQVRASGCERTIVREVTTDMANQQYKYKVKVNECGICKPLVIMNSWVVVSKLPVGWTVDFKSEVR